MRRKRSDEGLDRLMTGGLLDGCLSLVVVGVRTRFARCSLRQVFARDALGMLDYARRTFLSRWPASAPPPGDNGRRPRARRRVGAEPGAPPGSARWHICSADES